MKTLLFVVLILVSTTCSKTEYPFPEYDPDMKATCKALLEVSFKAGNSEQIEEVFEISDLAQCRPSLDFRLRLASDGVLSFQLPGEKKTLARQVSSFRVLQLQKYYITRTNLN